MQIKIKYFSKDYPRLEKISKGGDWVDLRVDSIKIIKGSIRSKGGAFNKLYKYELENEPFPLKYKKKAT